MVALKPPTPGFQPRMVPSSVANRKRALAVRVPMVTLKSDAVVLKTVPVGVPPVGEVGAGIVTTRGTVLPSPRYNVETPALLSDTQIGLVALEERPHGLTRFGSVDSANPGMSDTRFVWWNEPRAILASAGRAAWIARTATDVEIASVTPKNRRRAPLMVCMANLPKNADSLVRTTGSGYKSRRAEVDLFSGLPGEWRRMLWLVQAKLASTGTLDRGHRTPPYFLHFRTPDILRCKRCNVGVQIVRHEIEFVPNTPFGRMYGHFGRRQRKDQPIVTSIHEGESENVSEEGPIGDRVQAVHDHMGR